MRNLSKTLLVLLLAGFSSSVLASTQNYVYAPAAGVHETKTFHGCYDDADARNRTAFNVVMKGLNKNDVLVETRKLVANKPSSELLTFRLKNLDASLTVQFRSDDGPHCQQGVASITFKDATYRRFADLNVKR